MKDFLFMSFVFIGSFIYLGIMSYGICKAARSSAGLFKRRKEVYIKIKEMIGEAIDGLIVLLGLLFTIFIEYVVPVLVFLKIFHLI